VWIVGKRGGQEERIAADYGLKFRAVRTAKMPERKMSPGALMFPPKLAVSVASGWAAMGELKPAAVVGFGGFASFPTVAAAKLRGVPVFLHEQNMLVGLVNRVMSRFADKVFISFEATAGAVGGKSVFTGNPSRYEGIERMEKGEARKRLGLDPARWTLFVFGGSQGARSINRSMYDFAAASRESGDMQILHLAGRANYEEARGSYAEALKGGSLHVEVRDYLKEMEVAYFAADLALCRAGATTLTEVASLGVPSILSPYPFAAENHQEMNARSFVDAGAALMILDKDLSGDRIKEMVSGLRGRPERLAEMGVNARSLYRDGAAARMADALARYLN